MLPITSFSPSTTQFRVCAHQAPLRPFAPTSGAFKDVITTSSWLPRESTRRDILLCSAQGGDGPGNQGISEDVLARLRAAEEEAAKLRKELADAQGDKVRLHCTVIAAAHSRSQSPSRCTVSSLSIVDEQHHGSRLFDTCWQQPARSQSKLHQSPAPLLITRNHRKC